MAGYTKGIKREGATIYVPNASGENFWSASVQAAIAGREASEELKAWTPDVYSRSGAMRRTGDNLIVKNILRDCLQ